MKFIVAFFIAAISTSSWAWPTLEMSFSGNVIKHAGRYEAFNIDISKIRGWDRCTFWPVKENDLNRSSVTCFAKSGVAIGLDCYTEKAMLHPTIDDDKVWLYVKLSCQP